MKRRMYICGLARDCEDSVRSELEHLLELQRSSQDLDIAILVCENDSQDDTRAVIRDALAPVPRTHLNSADLLDGVDDGYPLRVHRLAFLRERLRAAAVQLDAERDGGGEGSIYLPIDLDGTFARSLTHEKLQKSVEYLDAGEVDAIFPTSAPFYYDVYALRCRGWVEYDSLEAVSRASSPLARLLAEWWFVSRPQRRGRRLTRAPLPVQSAFGGFGIYRLAAVSRASYLAAARVQCEHVTLNRQIGAKEIVPFLSVSAPHEHTELNLLSAAQLVRKLLKAAKKSSLRAGRGKPSAGSVPSSGEFR